MAWLQYLLLALLVFLLMRRFLPVKGLENLTAEQVKERLGNSKDHVFIDVRESGEYKQGHIRGFKNIPLSQLSNRLSEIDSQKVVVLTCRSGMRSSTAAKILRRHGYTRIAHLKTGISGWNGNLVR